MLKCPGTSYSVLSVSWNLLYHVCQSVLKPRMPSCQSVLESRLPCLSECPGTSLTMFVSVLEPRLPCLSVSWNTVFVKCPCIERSVAGMGRGEEEEERERISADSTTDLAERNTECQANLQNTNLSQRTENRHDVCRKLSSHPEHRNTRKNLMLALSTSSPSLASCAPQSLVLTRV